MLDLDNIKSGEQLSEEQLKDFLGNKEEKYEKENGFIGGISLACRRYFGGGARGLRRLSV